MGLDEAALVAGALVSAHTPPPGLSRTGRGRPGPGSGTQVCGQPVDRDHRSCPGPVSGRLTRAKPSTGTFWRWSRCRGERDSVSGACHRPTTGVGGPAGGGGCVRARWTDASSARSAGGFDAPVGTRRLGVPRSRAGTVVASPVPSRALEPGREAGTPGPAASRVCRMAQAPTPFIHSFTRSFIRSCDKTTGASALCQAGHVEPSVTFALLSCRDGNMALSTVSAAGSAIMGG